jgi:hypothetical protein
MSNFETAMQLAGLRDHKDPTAGVATGYRWASWE